MLAGHVMTRQLLAACLCLVLTACRAAAAPPATSPPDVVAQVTVHLQMVHSVPDTSQHREICAPQQHTGRHLPRLIRSFRLMIRLRGVQALGTLPTSNGAERSAWLSRSLQGSGFHRQLSYSLELQPCASGGSIVGIWQRLASALRLPQQLGGCAAVAAGDLCDVAVVQPLPAAVYADVDQLSSLAASWRGSAAALGFRLFGVADAERTEVECSPTVLLLHWTARAAEGQSASQQAGEAASGRAHPSAAVRLDSPAGRSIVTQRAIPVHARYPAPVLGGDSGSNASWWLGSWKSPVVFTVLPWPEVRVRCGSGSTADAAWQRVKTAPDAEDTGRMAWGIPAGDLRHAVFVNIVTALAYLVGAAFVLRGVFRSGAVANNRSTSTEIARSRFN
jgi:PIG-X / PBN1